MAPLIILVFSFIVFLTTNRLFFHKKLSLSFMGRSALGIMMFFTAITHFTQTEYMIQMLPDTIPYKTWVVYATGIFELAAVAGLFIRNTVKTTSYLLILFFLLILPANIIGSIKQVNLGGMEAGVPYLIFRIPLQVLFIIWTYYFGILKFRQVQ